MLKSESNNQSTNNHRLISNDKLTSNNQSTSDNKLTEEVEELRKFSFSLQRSITLLHWVGYGLLVLVLFDYIEIFFQPNFRNPAWGFQTLGAMVERVAVPLLGLVLVFYGGENRRARWELSGLKFLSWVAWGLGVLYLLLVPWGIFNTVAIQQNSTRQITTQVNQKLEQIQQVEEQVEKATTLKEVESIFNRLALQEQLTELKKSQQLAKIKENLSSILVVQKARVRSQAKSAQSSELEKLLKPSVKWNLGALVGGLLFMRIWLDTRWARSREYDQY